MNFLFLRLRSLKIQIHMKKILGITLILLAFVACKNDQQLNPEIEAMSVSLSIDRFDRLFANTTPATLPDVKNTYPYLFSKQYSDEFWEAKLSDTLQKELEREVANAFKDSNQLEEDLTLLYKHIQYYFPETSVPKVITIITEVREKVVLADTLLLIGLDNYLGKDHYFYQDIQRYKAKNFRKEQIDVDVASAFAKAHLEKQLAVPQSFWYFIKNKDTIVGYLKLNTEEAQTEFKQPDGLEIERIYIDVPYLGKGFGKKAIDFAISEALKREKSYIWLGVWEENPDAIRFYKKCGFTITGTHPYDMIAEIQTDYIMQYALTWK